MDIAIPLLLLASLGAGIALVLRRVLRRPEPAKKPNQDRALEVVWREVYGVRDWPFPRVEWVEGSRLTCKAGKGWQIETVFDHRTGARLTQPAKICIAGLTVNGGLVQVAWYPGAKFSDTALAHELWHAAMLVRKGAEDPFHRSPAFQPGGEVDRANAALKNAGL